MAQKTKQILKSYFETGDIPTQGNYVNLIDSLAVLQNDHNSGSLTLSGSLYISGSSYIDGNITSSGNISASGTIHANGGTMSDFITFDTSTGLRFVDENQNIRGTDTSIYIEADDVLYVNADVTAKFTTPKLWATGYAQVDGYVSGSSLISNTHITASGNISASGNVYADRLISNGNQVAYNDNGITYLGTATQAVKFSNHITASGNISASGTIYANNFQSAGGDVAGISFTDDLVLTGHLTASGNISSSGYIVAQNFATPGKIYLGQNIINTGTDYIEYNNGGFFYKGRGDFHTDLEVGTTLLVNSHITASGNISASGAIISNTLKVDGSQVDFTGLPTSDPGIVGRLYRTGADIKISI